MNIALVGMGMGNPKTLTGEAVEILVRADLLLGAPRLLESLPHTCGGKRIGVVSPQELLARMQSEQAKLACVVCSGDVGFYSLAASLRSHLGEAVVTTVPGITTVQYLAARLGRVWQKVQLVSAHGTVCNVVGHVLSSPETFFLTGGVVTPQSIARALTEAGLGQTVLAVGERLSYPDETITQGTAEELTGKSFSSLSAVWAVRPALPALHPYCTGGIPDDAFLQGKVPMTKQEVRAAILAKLQVRPGDVLYDVGAGTGSVSVELALASPMNTVYAIECKPEACALIEKNRIAFGAYSIRLIFGNAPEVLHSLPPPDGVFIGGSRGNLLPIVRTVLEKNPSTRLVISAVTAETFVELTQIARDCGLLDVELTQISVSHARAVGEYHLFTAQNPVFLMSGRGAGR